MELQWNQSVCRYMHRQVWDTQNLEQTQELRLHDGMPDIGRIICAWGQCVLRGKEWRKDCISVTGGVTAWVLYSPEDGSEPVVVETWLPFQGKWNLQDSRCEGFIGADVCLRGVDARILSAGKMMVRASVGLTVEAMEPMNVELFSPPEMPDGVQLLHNTYPAVLPVEAGERQFTLEEPMPWQGELPEKIIAWQVTPKLSEQNVVGSRAVFRGNNLVHIICKCQDGKISSCDLEIPLAQYVDLDGDYDKEATICIRMGLSSVEPEIREDGMWLKCGMIAQYTVYDRQLIHICEDAYSPCRMVSPTYQSLKLPMVLDRVLERIDIPMPPQQPNVADCCFYPDSPAFYRQGDMLEGELSGKIQMLYYNSEDALECHTEQWSQQWQLPVDESSHAYVYMQNGPFDMQLEMLLVTGEEIPMITGLQLGEDKKMDPARPSLILKRMGEGTLWDLAKATGSTVEAIRSANQLSGEPEPDQMLLIPVC